MGHKTDIFIIALDQELEKQAALPLAPLVAAVARPILSAVARKFVRSGAKSLGGNVLSASNVAKAAKAGASSAADVAVKKTTKALNQPKRTVAKAAVRIGATKAVGALASGAGVATDIARTNTAPVNSAPATAPVNTSNGHTVHN